MKVVNIFALVALFGLSSCLTIVNTLTTSDTIVNDSRVEGLWVDGERKQILVQKLMDSRFKNVFKELDPKDYTRQDSINYIKHYVITYRENALEYIWLAGLVEIHGSFYLNLQAEECLSNGKEIYGGLATSSIAKLSWESNNSLVIRFLNGDSIKEIILEGKARVRHMYDPLFGTFIITASSQELRQFLEKYGDDNRLFKGGNSIILNRKS
ncbi:MAG TPA: hypothetical protein VF144_20795 [Chitinophagaceae bacterium]